MNYWRSAREDPSPTIIIKNEADEVIYRFPSNAHEHIMLFGRQSGGKWPPRSEGQITPRP